MYLGIDDDDCAAHNSRADAVAEDSACAEECSGPESLPVCRHLLFTSATVRENSRAIPVASSKKAQKGGRNFLF